MEGLLERERDEVMKRAVTENMYVAKYLPLRQTVHEWEKQTVGAEILQVLYVAIFHSVTYSLYH